MSDKKLIKVLERINTETGISLQAIRLSFGEYEDGYEWAAETLPGRSVKGKPRRPAFSGYNGDPELAADDLIEEWRRWNDPSIQAKEEEARLLAELREGK